MRRTRKLSLFLAAGLTATLFEGCGVSGLAGDLASGLLNDCFGEGTISASEYDDLNVFEQALYEENDCGRYEPASNIAEDILDIF